MTIAHVPGICNKIADFRSRNFVDNTKWELNPKIFKRACEIFGTPEVDLFASRLTKKLEKFVSCSLFFLLSVCWAECFRSCWQTERELYWWPRCGQVKPGSGGW